MGNVVQVSQAVEDLDSIVTDDTVEDFVQKVSAFPNLVSLKFFNDNTSYIIIINLTSLVLTSKV